MSSEATSIAQQAADLSSNISNSDISKQLLDSFFGSGWNTIGWGESISSGTSTSLIFDLFGAINLLAMFCASALMVWYTCYGVIGTAHEGRFLGKRMHSIWAPVRSVISVSFLAPVFQGLCLLQILCLLCIGISVHFANNLWCVGLDYMAANKGHLTSAANPELKKEIEELSAQIFHETGIQNYMIVFQEKSLSGGYCKYDSWVPIDSDDADAGGYHVIKFNLPTGSRIDGFNASDFGIIRIKASSSTEELGNARADAIVTAVNSMGAVGKSFMEVKHAGTGSVPTYSANVSSIITTYANSINSAYNDVQDDTEDEYQEEDFSTIWDKKKLDKDDVILDCFDNVSIVMRNFFACP